MTIQQTLGELTTRYPAAAKIFYKYGLDYCCGGKQALDAACREKNLNPAKVLTEIQSQDGNSSDSIRWEKQPLSELIDYILTRYHAPLREDLPRLIDLAGTVEQVHADNTECPKGLTKTIWLPSPRRWKVTWPRRNRCCFHLSNRGRPKMPLHRFGS